MGALGATWSLQSSIGGLCRTQTALSVFSCSGLGPRALPKIINFVDFPWVFQLFSTFSLFGSLLVFLGRLGAVLGRLGAVLVRSWGVLGPSWGDLGRSWGGLGRSWGGLGRPGGVIFVDFP